MSQSGDSKQIFIFFKDGLIFLPYGPRCETRPSLISAFVIHLLERIMSALGTTEISVV